MAYFDNAATTYPKPEVVYARMDQFYRACGGSAGRGQHGLAKSTGTLVAETRSLLQQLLHCPVKQVIFTPTATIALNMIIQGVIARGAKNIYITPFEHNAVTRTLHHFEKNDLITVTQLAVSDTLAYDLERIKYQFEATRPDFVITTHASNVCGLIAPAEKICTVAKQFGAVTLVDMAQTAGLVDLNVGLAAIDFAVFAGHKTLYGPTGLSGFVMPPSFDLPPVLFGGTGYDSANQDMPDSRPERYEMGTMNTAGMAGLHAALEWGLQTTISAMWDKEQAHRQRLLSVLEKYNFIRVVGNVPGRDYVGIVSCLIDGISSDSAGSLFNQLNVAVRTGLQCAPLAHQFLHTYPAGTVRLSVGYFTSNQDFETLEQALSHIDSNR